MNTLTLEDKQTLRTAHQKMEDIGWAMRGLNRMGNFIQGRIDMLPQKQQKWLQKISYNILFKVVQSNLVSMKKGGIPKKPMSNSYKALVTTSGALGGSLGATAFVVDLGIATKFMMRSIMDIARSEGEDLEELDTQLACLQVFALGGKTKHDDHLETGYYASRIALNAAVKGASGKLVEGLLTNTANPILKVIGMVASRFSVQVSEKFVAQAIPVVGAFGGGAINLAFIQHFQNMAEAHFSIRRLERTYGAETVREAYEALEIQV